jgi:molybdate transport system permease protein
VVDWSAFLLSLRLSFWTTLLLLPLGLVVGRGLAWRRIAGKGFLEALVATPLVLPPTVLGYYLLVAMGGASPLGRIYEDITGRALVFNFDGLLVASVIINIPFAIQPLQRSFEAIPADIREAAWCSGLSRWWSFATIELPLAWPGVISAVALTFAHTMGEFGVVLMVGGNIPGTTKTAAIAIYDRAQAFDQAAAGAMSATLLLFSLVAIALAYSLSRRIGRRVSDPRR